jgi:hypothetical protein
MVLKRVKVATRNVLEVVQTRAFVAEVKKRGSIFFAITAQHARLQLGESRYFLLRTLSPAQQSTVVEWQYRLTFCDCTEPRGQDANY